MKLEANKIYRTRDGQKAMVTCVDAPDRRSCVGYVYAKEGVYPCLWTIEGFNFSSVKVQSDLDLISEWVDEPKTKKVTLRRALYSSKGGYWLSEFTSFDREKTPGFLRWHDSIEVEVPVKE